MYGGTSCTLALFSQEKIPELMWEMLMTEMIQRYCGRKVGNSYEMLAERKQEGFVNEYIKQFEVLAAKVGEMLEGRSLGYFMGRLKEDLRG